MVRLHLIGFTTDLKNLIFATRRTAKRGGYILEIDKRLTGALEEVTRLASGGDQGADLIEQPAPAGATAAAAVRPSVLSPKEIQTLLREGKSEEQVAKLAQTDVSWIRRFTGPIVAEKAGVIESVRSGLIAKPRLGPSAVSVGQAIQQNLAEKRVPMDPEAFERSWKAARRNGRWQVVFQYSSRGKKRLARFSFNPESREVAAANDVALDVAWRPGNLRRARKVNGSQNGPRKTSGPPASRKRRSSPTTKTGRAKSASVAGRAASANSSRRSRAPGRGSH